ncbi:MAG TPA: RNA polymerase sigma factor [Vicinamibacterales bacterium]|jgi:RNA polymerase sigma-70 factor (ECF subfamily)|nr:RNA polymerase sigma factor [Vicinamibacterales bacterium]
MDRESELALVERVRAGETAAFDAIHEAFNGRLYGFLARLARSRDVAEDLLEETWLRFLKNAGQLHADTRLGPWLFTVARNVHITWCRSRAMESRATATLDLWPTGSAGDSPFEQAATSELERRIEHALAALPVDAREALLLVGVEGLTPSEAAAVCGVTPEAMRQRLKRARAQLAKQLEDPSPGPIIRLREVEP